MKELKYLSQTSCCVHNLCNSVMTFRHVIIIMESATRQEKPLEQTKKTDGKIVMPFTRTQF